MSGLSSAEYRALAEFRHQLQRFLQRRNRAARQAGLAPQLYQVMLAIKGTPKAHSATVGEVAERLQIRTHSVAELMNRLEERRLIQRQRNPHDRRVVHVSLTATGETLLRKLVTLSLTELRSEAPALIEALSTVLGRRYVR